MPESEANWLAVCTVVTAPVMMAIKITTTRESTPIKFISRTNMFQKTRPLSGRLNTYRINNM